MPNFFDVPATTPDPAPLLPAVRREARRRRRRHALLAGSAAVLVLAGTGIAVAATIGQPSGPDQVLITPAAPSPTDSPSVMDSPSAPASATPASPSPSPTPTPTPTPRSSLTEADWETVSYPFDCDGFGYVVNATHYADLNGDGRLDAVVLVRCHAGAGSPPSGLYVYDGISPPDNPRLMATLLSPKADREANAFTITGTTVSMDVYGYSSPSVPRCCPDEKYRMTWVWNGPNYSSTSERLPCEKKDSGGPGCR